MKNFTLLLSLFILLLSSNSNAQILMSENFEVIDSVVSSGIPGWGQTNTVQTSGFFSDSSHAIGTDTSRLTTISFSTMGFYTIKLRFNHVVWGEQYRSRVLISIDNGGTWNQLGANEYLGNAQNFNFSESFSSNDYCEWAQSFICLGFPNNVLGNNRFQSELFDVSNICANQANVQIRFDVNNDSLPPLTFTPNGGWFIDDLVVTGTQISIASTVSCNNDGTASVNPSFGQAPHTYLWNTSSTSQTISNLPAGVYTVTVTDNFGLSVTDSVTVLPAFDLQVIPTNPNCPAANGSAFAFVTGGTSPYSYLWSNGQIGANVNGLPVGTYTVTVTDANGCFFAETFTLICDLGFNVSPTPSSCSTPSGTATVNSVSNGTPPYNYQWNTLPVQTTQTATGLNGNTLYTVTVFDAAGKSANSVVVIPFTDTIVVNATTTPSQCNLATGAASATASGGTAPYKYSWNSIPIQSTAVANNLSNQNYIVTATDANGCEGNFTVLIPSVSTLSAIVSSNTTLCGQSTGTAIVNASGGTPPYTYLWNTTPPQTTLTAINLPYGNHSVAVSDNANCTIIRNTFVNQFNNINVNISYPNTSCLCVDPTAFVTGGTPPYTYLWDNGNTSQTATCIDEGWHYVSVTDANGCTKNKGYFVTFSANCYITITGNVFADLNSDCVKDPSEYGIANVPINLSKQGAVVQTYLTNPQGDYSFYILNDTFEVSQLTPINWNQNCPSSPSSYTIITNAGSTVTNDFADTANTFIDEVEIYNCFISGRARGFISNYFIYVRNNGTNQLNGTLSSTHDALLNFSGAIPPVSAYNSTTRTAEWNYFNLNPGETRIYNLQTLIPASTPLGTTINNSSSITPLASDIVPSNNDCNVNAVVVGSWDPNDKIANPDGDILIDSLWHSYLINFQNTGTAPAVRVIVVDTIDSNLDFNSMTDFASSHNYEIDSSQAPVIRFIFNNINLLDSNVSFSASQGFISFRIKRIQGLPVNTQISNTAYIYFDFNSPIQTNTVINTISIAPGINELNSSISVMVYPNPSTGIVKFNFSSKNDKVKELQIFNLASQLIINKELVGNQFESEIDLSSLSAGVYTYRIITQKGNHSNGRISILK